MNKILCAVFTVLMLATIAFAVQKGGQFVYSNPAFTSGGTAVQGFAPNGTKDVTLAVTSQTVDMRNDLAWGAYAPADCKFRNMTTATKAGSLHTLPGGSWFVRVVNPSTPFTNISGCTSGELQRQ